MGNNVNETRDFPPKETAQSPYTCTTIDTLTPVHAALQQLLACEVEAIALVAIRLHYEIDARHDLAIRSTTHLVDSLRVLVRKTDQLFLHGHTMYFVLRDSTQEGGEIVQARLWEALLWRVHNMSEPEMLRPHTVTIGHSGFQEVQSSTACCIDTACIAQLRYEWHPEKPRKTTRPGQSVHARTFEPIDEELSALARKLGIPYLTLLPRKLPKALQQLVTPTLAQELRCFPLGRERDTLTVAMLDPQNSDALDRLRTETGLRIFPVLAHPQELQYALEQFV